MSSVISHLCFSVNCFDCARGHLACCGDFFLWEHVSVPFFQPSRWKLTNFSVNLCNMNIWKFTSFMYCTHTYISLGKIFSAKKMLKILIDRHGFFSLLSVALLCLISFFKVSKSVSLNIGIMKICMSTLYLHIENNC